jgi:hypothetical protein
VRDPRSGAEIEKRSKPASYEPAVKKNCRRAEAVARATLSNDFLAVQALRMRPVLSPKTREFNRKSDEAIRQEACRRLRGKSCQGPARSQVMQDSHRDVMCDQRERISLDETPKEQREYECAMSD